ncbi:MAG: hypothetical protein ABI054_06080 [Planctomycetota bacterium]
MASVSPKAKERARLLHVRNQMLKRCHDPLSKRFADYGGRGITVCERWRESPRAFIDDVWPRPLGMTIERPDNSRGYGPDNFRWATRAEQARNKRNNIWCEVGGVRMILKDACRKLCLPYRVIAKRIAKGIPPAVALTAPSRYSRGFTTPTDQ